MIFLGVALQYMQKIDIGIAIVCMVNHTAINDVANSPYYENINQTDKCLNKIESQIQTVTHFEL
jgi:hypothetical protein